MKVLPDISVLNRIFEYDAETGLLTWKRRFGDQPGASKFNSVYAGRTAGSPHQRGYLQVSFTFEGVKYKALVHRICFAMHFGFYPEMVDHRNNNRTDNRAVNLREADASRNQCNRAGVVAKSGFKGVFSHRATGKFFSQIRFKGRYEFLGIHETEEECARAYDAAATRLYGDFSRTNASLNLIGA